MNADTEAQLDKMRIAVELADADYSRLLNDPDASEHRIEQARESANSKHDHYRKEEARLLGFPAQQGIVNYKETGHV